MGAAGAGGTATGLTCWNVSIVVRLGSESIKYQLLTLGWHRGVDSHRLFASEWAVRQVYLQVPVHTGQYTWGWSVSAA